MNLHSGLLYWPTTCPVARSAQRLRVDSECEVLVVGAGITGAMVAWELARSGVDTIVVDRRTIAAGSTSASTAMLMYELDVPLVELRCMVGCARADRAYRASRRAVDDIARVVTELDDPCEFMPRRSLLLASCAADVDGLRLEAAARREVGVEAEFVIGEELQRQFGVYRAGALLCDGSAEVNPVRLTQALFRAAAAKGVRIFDGTELMLSPCDRRPYVAKTVEGCAITCRSIVIATGYETPEQFAGVDELTTLRSTYAVASRPFASMPWPDKVLIWETARPYSYLRTTADGRVIVGGEDCDVTDPASRDARIGASARCLAGKAAAILPGLHIQPAFAWVGTFAETEDSLPLIGAIDCWPGVHFALGYGGNGITFSELAAQIIRDAVVGRRNEDAATFSIGAAIARRGLSVGGARAAR